MNHLRKSGIYHGAFTPDISVYISYEQEYSVSKHSTIINLGTFNTDIVLSLNLASLFQFFQQIQNVLYKSIFLLVQNLV